MRRSGVRVPPGAVVFSFLFNVKDKYFYFVKITFAFPRPAGVQIQEVNRYLFGLQMRKIWSQVILFFAGLPFSLAVVTKTLDLKLIFKVVLTCYSNVPMICVLYSPRIPWQVTKLP